MRKCVTLAAALLLGTVSLFAQTRLTPYEYGQRWFFAFQGGPLYFNSDYCTRLSKAGRTLELFSIGAGVALGYNISDAHAIRFMGNYSRKTGVCEAFVFEDIEPAPIYTYKFRSLNFFADHVLNYNALAENFMPFTAKTYAGLGLAYTFDFTEPGHPEVWLTDPNLVPGLHFGFLLEYDFKDGFGLYTDLGLAFYFDRYNGRERIGFPLDMEIYLQMGLIYNFPLKNKVKR